MLIASRSENHYKKNIIWEDNLVENMVPVYKIATGAAACSYEPDFEDNESLGIWSGFSSTNAASFGYTKTLTYSYTPTSQTEILHLEITPQEILGRIHGDVPINIGQDAIIAISYKVKAENLLSFQHFSTDFQQWHYGNHLTGLDLNNWVTVTDTVTLNNQMFLSFGGEKQNMDQQAHIIIKDLSIKCLEIDGYQNSNVYENKDVAYRFGFNGQERDDEIAGSGNSYTAEFWQYDSRLGRRWNLDPVDQISVSNYAAFLNNPIYMIDPLGNTATKYEDEAGNEIVPETQDGSDDVVTITDDKLKGFMASYKGTSEEARNSQEMNDTWKAYSGNNIKSDKLDPSTLGRNIGGTNYIGKDNPQTYPNARDKRKWDYSASPLNLADYAAFLHDKAYDKIGTEGLNGVLSDTKAIGADWRFVGNQIQLGKTALMMGDYNSAILSYGTALGMGLGATGKTLFQLSKPMGATEMLLWDKVSQPTTK